MTNSEQHVATQFDLWQTGVISKYEFYASTMSIRVSTVSAVTGIEVAVIQDRRRYLRQLAAQAVPA